MNELETRGLVTSAWLETHLSDPDLVILDSSWYLPDMGRAAKAEFEAAHIPGALFADIDALSDQTSKLPHMLPPPETFERSMAALGISNDHRVVAYDGAGLFSAARIWWMFRAMGHDRVALLDGGFPKWTAEGRPTQADARTPSRTTFRANFDPDFVWSADQVQANLATHRAQIIDARGADRFHAREPEARPGVRGGHIPGSKNIPYRSLLSDDGTFKSDDELRGVFENARVDLAQPIATSCGSGVTAAILSFGLFRLGIDPVALYDGSWTEWGGRTDLPLEIE
jgi:thiosulfate/3-mercaptopyruvate sulfurtransferase